MPKEIWLTAFKDWDVLDSSERGKKAKLPAGKHKMERIPNPFHPESGYWLVIAGSTIGAAEGSLRQWSDFDDEWKIIIEET